MCPRFLGFIRFSAASVPNTALPPGTRARAPREKRRQASWAETVVFNLYDAAATDRKRFDLGMYGLLDSLALAGLAIAWYFAKLLGRSYQQERDALEAARKALAARDEIMGIVAHDLRNPSAPLR